MAYMCDGKVVKVGRRHFLVQGSGQEETSSLIHINPSPRILSRGQSGVEIPVRYDPELLNSGAMSEIPVACYSYESSAEWIKKEDEV